MSEDLTRASVLTGLQAAEVRQIARKEIASMAALVLRRTQMDEAHLSRSIERNAADDEVRRHLAEIFGEVLSDYSRTENEPGA